jgi:hypothetical protein
MTEDIVEFGATAAPKPKRAPGRAWPRWLENRILPLAAVGALAGVASMILPWQKLTPRSQEGNIQQSSQPFYEATVIALGANGTAYLVTLIATVTAVSMIFFGHSLVPAATRVIGAALSAANLSILVATAVVFQNGTLILNVGLITFGPEELARTDISLDWGFYAALAAVITLGIAALRAQPISHPAVDEDSESGDDGDVSGDEFDDEDDDGVIDLSVSVHPVGKQVAAG